MKYTIYTFNYFWHKFHFITNRKKVNKELARTIWNNCNFSNQKKDAIYSISKSIDVNANEYLKTKLY